ncbi:MAG: energy transducer TonB [candidate division WOR-3 bacterium]
MIKSEAMKITFPVESTLREDRRIDYALILSILIHIILLILFSRAQKAIRDYRFINQITFIDQTYRPEVAKILPKAAVTPGTSAGKEKGITPPTPTLAPPKTDEATEEVSSIDFAQRLDRSQALIDLNRYEVNQSQDELDVIRIGSLANGTQKSTEEILLEKPIELASGLSRGAGGLGLAGYPGIGVSEEPPIQIEHKPLEKPRQTVEVRPKARASDEIEGIATEPVRGTNIFIAGPISKRTILTKFLPQYPEWALQRGISGVAIIRIWVLPDGTVKETMTIEQSSGYPELDMLVINALRRWKFAPLSPQVVQEVQWGVITFKFCLI